MFVYNKVAHDVLTVTAADYASCTFTSTNQVQTGNDTITLVAGVNSFVCGIPGHCAEGQKLTVTANTASVVQGASYIVGDAAGWRVPDTPNFYETWASDKSFVAGDTLRE